MNPKVLHDALLILDRELTAATNTYQVSVTDINDSDDNFNRRLTNIVEQQDRLQSQVQSLLKTFDLLEVERIRMLDVRLSGSAAELRRNIKLLTLKRNTVQLAILQMELDNAD